MLISNSIKIDNGLSEIIKDTINTINVDAINIKYLDSEDISNETFQYVQMQLRLIDKPS